MYMVPQHKAAPAAARMPLAARPVWAPPSWRVAKPSITAAATMANAPTTTLATFLPLAPLSSPNSTRPHRMPTSELAFHSGKAMVSPTSRMAKTVSVLATAHSIPARIAVSSRCRFLLRSANTDCVPLSSVGTVQRAVNTPATLHSEIAYGDRPELTSLVGASAAPSHTPAASPHATPIPWPAPDRILALVRSEEHTSELQSRQYLVCRLLLEKKG